MADLVIHDFKALTLADGASLSWQNYQGDCLFSPLINDLISTNRTLISFPITYDVEYARKAEFENRELIAVETNKLIATSDGYLFSFLPPLEWIRAASDIKDKNLEIELENLATQYIFRVRAKSKCPTEEIGEWYYTTVSSGYFLKIFHSDTDIQYWSDSVNLVPPKSLSYNIDPAKADASIASISCTLKNNQNSPVNPDDVSKWLYEKINDDVSRVYRAKAELEYYDNETETTTTKFIGLVKNVVSMNDDLEYRIEIYNFLDELKKPIFDREINDYSYLGVRETIEQVQTRLNTLFPNSAHTTPITPDPITDPNFLGWGVVEYDDNGTTRRRIIFRGHPIDMLKSIFMLLYTEIKIDPSLFTAYDTSYTDLVDIAALDQLKSELTGYEVEFFFDEVEEDVLEFCRKKIYIPLVIYPIITAEGKLSFKQHKQPVIGDAVLTLSENNITDNILRNSKLDFTKLVNYLRINSNFSFSENKYLDSTVFIETASFDKRKKLIPDQPQEIEFHNSVNNTVDDNEIKNKVFSRFAETQQIIKCSIADNIENANVGDYVFYTNKTQYDWRENKRGITGADDPDNIANLSVGENWGSYQDVNDLNNYNGTPTVTIDEEMLVETFTDFAAIYQIVSDYLQFTTGITTLNLIDANEDNLIDANDDNLTVPV